MANPVPRDSVRQAAAAASAVLLSEARARTRRVHGHCGRHASALTDPEVGTRLPGPLSAGDHPVRLRRRHSLPPRQLSGLGVPCPARGHSQSTIGTCNFTWNFFCRRGFPLFSERIFNDRATIFYNVAS